jgi:FeS assembly SUF system protein
MAMMGGGMDNAWQMAMGDVPDPEDLVAHMGEPLPDGAAVAGVDDVVAAMRTVYDPEIPVNIYDLGLIYENTISDKGDVTVVMTLTAPNCPVAADMPGMVARAVVALDGVGEVDVSIVFDPPWTPAMMSEDAKLALGVD